MLARVERFCLAIVLAVGFAIPVLMGAMFLFSESTSIYRTIVFDQQGTPLIRTNSYAGGLLKQEYTNLDGSLPEVPPTSINWPRAGILNATPPDILWQQVWDRRVTTLTVSGNHERWFYVIHRPSVDGLAYFVSYDMQARSPTRYVGRHGTQDAFPTREEMFPIHPVNYGTLSGTLVVPGQMWYSSGAQQLSAEQPQLYLLSDSQLWAVDLIRGKISPAFDVGEIRDIASIQTHAVNLGREDMGNPYESSLLLRTQKEIILFDTSETELRRYTIPEEFRTTSFTFHVLGADKAAIEVVNQASLQAGVSLFLVKSDGTVTARHEQVIKHVFGNFRPHQDAWKMAMAVPAGSWALLVTCVMLPMDYDISVGQSIRKHWLALVIGFSASFFSVALTMVTLRRRGAPISIGWLVFVFVLGLPGYVGFALHQKWPRRQAIPAPTMTGAEVFG